MAPTYTLRLTFQSGGQDRYRELRHPASQRKAKREVAEFRRYQEVSRAFIEVNAQICRVRPVEDTLSPEEKRPKRSTKKSRAK